MYMCAACVHCFFPAQRSLNTLKPYLLERSCRLYANTSRWSRLQASLLASLIAVHSTLSDMTPFVCM